MLVKPCRFLLDHFCSPLGLSQPFLLDPVDILECVPVECLLLFPLPGCLGSSVCQGELVVPGLLGAQLFDLVLLCLVIASRMEISVVLKLGMVVSVSLGIDILVLHELLDFLEAIFVQLSVSICCLPLLLSLLGSVLVLLVLHRCLVV